jgi:hypothetical protein
MERTEISKLEKFTKELSALHLAITGGLFLIIIVMLVFMFDEYVFIFDSSKNGFI